MGKIKALLALLSGLKIVSLVRWIPLPGLGWLGGAASAVLAVVASVVGAAFKGLTVMFANPVTLVTVGVVAMTTFALGLQMGASEGVRRVEKAEQERVIAHANAEQRAREAIEARRAAEAAEAQLAAVQPLLAQTKPSNPSKPRSSGVRAKPKSDADSDRPWMHGVPAVSFPGF
jgi:hypothetical protein